MTSTTLAQSRDDAFFQAEEASAEYLSVFDDPNVLLRRTTSGLLVEVSWLPLMDMVVLHVAWGDGEDRYERAGTIPSDKALDAFAHPFSYLPSPEGF